MADIMRAEVAPDSRLRRIVTAVGARWDAFWGFMEPVFCANCGVQGPWVPEKNMDFAFWLCDKKQNGCFEKFGEIAGTMVMPDQVWWEKIKQESLEKHGRELSHAEISVVVASDSSPLATLIKEGR